MGLAFAFGWTPCIGPVLATILAVAASKESAAEGGILLSVYSAGLGVPFILTAGAVGSLLLFMKRFRGHLHRVEQVMGGLLIITGIMFLTGAIQSASYWLLESFPGLVTLG
jgi:cytochrome c-type biogenesis protein